jgi:hypothetical protein
MALVTGAFPYDIDHLLGGAVRVLYAPTSVAIPTGINSVIDMVSPYAAKTGWLEFGATKEAFSYSRAFEVQGYEIQQLAGNVLEEISSITRQVTLSAAEIRKEVLAIMEARDARYCRCCFRDQRAAGREVWFVLHDHGLPDGFHQPSPYQLWSSD